MQYKILRKPLAVALEQQNPYPQQNWKWNLTHTPLLHLFLQM